MSYKIYKPQNQIFKYSIGTLFKYNDIKIKIIGHFIYHKNLIIYEKGVVLYTRQFGKDWIYDSGKAVIIPSSNKNYIYYVDSNLIDNTKLDTKAYINADYLHTEKFHFNII